MFQSTERFGRCAPRALARLIPCLILLAALTAPAAAQQAKNALPEDAKISPIIGVVDVQEVLRDSSAAKGLRQAAEAKGKSLEAGLNKQREEVKAREQQLRQQQTILSPAAFDQKRQELESYVNNLRREAEVSRAQINQVFNGAMAQVNDELRKSVVVIMEKRGVAMTLPRSAVLVFDQRMNLTKEVTELLNQRLPSVKVDFNKPPPAPKRK
ncbi:MAG: OmpH family outer membrane protein [Alphaproteobacteria bacterium]